MTEGTVVRSTGSWYSVILNTGEEVNCRVKGKFRLENFKLSNPIAVGDIVKIQMDPKENIGLIVEIKPRSNYVVRESPKKRGFVHILASNIDQAVLVTTIAHPKLKLGFIDRFLLMTETYEIPTVIVFNKIDLYTEEEMDMCQGAVDLYCSIGYPSIMTSATTKDGLDKLEDVLRNKDSLIAGHSGVGKSTIANHLVPGLDLKTDLLSNSTGKGQHTTTFAEMYILPIGGRLIDTPGIKTLSFNYLSPQDVAHNFKEIFAKSKSCKFADCTHRNEPKCAVHEALNDGSIHEIRYFNYLQILEDIEGQNYWERVNDI